MSGKPNINISGGSYFEGNNPTGHIIGGNYEIQVGGVYGGVVNFVQPDQRPSIKERSTPIYLRPPRFDGFLGREKELKKAMATLKKAKPVEVSGEAGIGKSTFLKIIAHKIHDFYFSDGVFFHSGPNYTVSDLLQIFFDFFYDTHPPFKATETQIRQALRGKKALILLDHVDLSPEEIQQLIDFVPDCTFIFTSLERRWRGWGKQAITLKGLPQTESLELIQREIGRPLNSKEQKASKTIYKALKGHPFSLLQAAALLDEEDKTLSDLANETKKSPEPEKWIVRTLVNILPNSEKEILLALAALGGARLHEEHLAELTQNSNIRGVLRRLEQRGLIQSDGTFYTLAELISQTLQQMGDTDRWAERFLSYFIRWAEENQHHPQSLARDLDAILVIFNWAKAKGRSREVLRLGKAIDSPLILSKRWGSWKYVLGIMLLLGDKQIEIKAWVLHQLGVRSLCLDEPKVAHQYLTEAAQIRKELGDQQGLQITNHNLEIVNQLHSVGWFSFSQLILRVVLPLTVVTGISVGSFHPSIQPNPVSSAISTVIPLDVIFPQPTPTPTPSPTPIPPDTTPPQIIEVEVEPDTIYSYEVEVLSFRGLITDDSPISSVELHYQYLDHEGNTYGWLKQNVNIDILQNYTSFNTSINLRPQEYDDDKDVYAISKLVYEFKFIDENGNYNTYKSEMRYDFKID